MAVVWIVDVRIDTSLFRGSEFYLSEKKGEVYLENIPEVLGLSSTTANGLVQQHIKESIVSTSQLDFLIAYWLNSRRDMPNIKQAFMPQVDWLLV